MCVCGVQILSFFALSYIHIPSISSSLMKMMMMIMRIFLRVLIKFSINFLLSLSLSLKYVFVKDAFQYQKGNFLSPIKMQFPAFKTNVKVLLVIKVNPHNVKSFLLFLLYLFCKCFIRDIYSQAYFMFMLMPVYIIIFQKLILKKIPILSCVKMYYTI